MIGAILLPVILDPKQVMISVIHSRQKPWEDIVRQGQFMTWVPNALSKGFQVSYCYGPTPNLASKWLDETMESLRWRRGPLVSDIRNLINFVLAYPFKNTIPKVKEEEYLGAPRGVRGLRVPIWDSYSTTRWRQLALIKYFVERSDLEILVMTTSASYLIPELLLDSLKKINSKIIYAGPTYTSDRSEMYASGALIIMNRNFAQLLLRNIDFIPTQKVNDLAFGDAARKLEIQLTPLPTLNLDSEKQVPELSLAQIHTNFHYRLKSIVDGEREDVKLFTALHKRLSTQKLIS